MNEEIAMAKKVGAAKKAGRVPSAGKTGKTAPPLLDRFRKEAESLQKQLSSKAERTMRQLERQFLHQVHAATEDQVKRLERRVDALEKQVKEYDRRVRAVGVI
jgi:hypothetical protein